MQPRLIFVFLCVLLLDCLQAVACFSGRKEKVDVAGLRVTTTAYEGQVTVALTGNDVITMIIDLKGSGTLGMGVGTPDHLNEPTHHYNDNHDMAWHWNAYHGHVSKDFDGSDGPYAPRHAAGVRKVVVTIRDGTLSFAVDDVIMPGSWAIPSPAYLVVSPWGRSSTIDFSFA